MFGHELRKKAALAVMLQVCWAGSASARDDAAGALCGMACGAYLFICLAVIALNIAILVWVAKDAKSRGMGSAIGWVFLMLFTGLLGLVIYLFSRPSGDLVHCEHCKNKKLTVARVCPHCGNESRPFAAQPSQNPPQQAPRGEAGAGMDAPAPAPAPQPAQDRQEQVQFCSQCGTRLQPDDLFCAECGNKIVS